MASSIGCWPSVASVKLLRTNLAYPTANDRYVIAENIASLTTRAVIKIIRMPLSL